mmetsp:Transcript_5400/g.7796  ORF Transcript_5400/g.7796 Transcript_5400/m.7796 type:complete len:615 (+) Transcript_5400:85-1929(+)|eukprot:CAMPEP_0194218668 /NCGR_PEP_ID=MMETSP0156-20130528/24345_1 /TAXON_ID=33649 /ORGANISM="Thalassionema nitzschioides, Strain L26-B" /LENGTH=614 /DNA_ID=CAMNT_0038948119 /DNA_START=56 /DNA_END=1900 /DNA_ORIENTATION=-
MRGQEERSEKSSPEVNRISYKWQPIRERLLHKDNDCEDELSLATKVYPDAHAYGVMFTVRSKAESLLIQTLEINHAQVQEEIRVLVYMKDGGYQNFENNATAWKQLFNSYIIPTKQEGSTLLPAREFVPVEVDANQEISFYVTLDTSSLWCSRSLAKSAGAAYIEDDNLQLFVGASLFQFPFSDQLLEPCAFSGRFHYKEVVDCDASVISNVPFSFLVQHDDMTQDALFEKIDFLLKGSISSLIRTDAEMKVFVDNMSLTFDDLNTMVSHSSDAYAECIAKTTRSCTALTSELTFTHNGRLRQAYLMHRLLSHRWKISRNMNLQKSMEITYIGLIPVETHFILNLEGVPAGEDMNQKHRSYLEKRVEAFLKDKLLEFHSLQILEVVAGNVTEQVSIPSVDIALTVTGTVKPSPYVDITYLVEDAIEVHSASFLEELVNYRDLFLSMQDGKYFADVKQISARNDKNTVSARSDKPSQGVILTIFIASFLFLAGCGWYIRRRRGRQKYKVDATDSSEHKSTKFLDEGIVSSSSYSDAFNRVSRIKTCNDSDISTKAQTNVDTIDHDEYASVFQRLSSKSAHVVAATNSTRDDCSNSSAQSADQSVETVRHSNRHLI